MERAGVAPGLSSPLIGSTAKLGMAIGAHPLSDGALKPAYVRKGQMKCQGCGNRFERTAKERMCAPCFVARNRPVWA